MICEHFYLRGNSACVGRASKYKPSQFFLAFARSRSIMFVDETSLMHLRKSDWWLRRMEIIWWPHETLMEAAHQKHIPGNPREEMQSLDEHTKEKSATWSKLNIKLLSILKRISERGRKCCIIALLKFWMWGEIIEFNGLWQPRERKNFFELWTDVKVFTWKILSFGPWRDVCEWWKDFANALTKNVKLKFWVERQKVWKKFFGNFQVRNDESDDRKIKCERFQIKHLNIFQLYSS